MERPSRPSTVASCVAASRIAARLRSPSERRRYEEVSEGVVSSSPKIRLDKIARPVVLSSHGERSIVLTTERQPASVDSRSSMQRGSRSGTSACSPRGGGQSASAQARRRTARGAPSCGTSRHPSSGSRRRTQRRQVATTSRTAARGTRAARPRVTSLPEDADRERPLGPLLVWHRRSPPPRPRRDGPSARSRARPTRSTRRRT